MTTGETQRLFTGPESWGEGSHELTFILGRSDDATLTAVREAIWTFADLEGCWLRRDVEPASQARVPSRGPPLETALYGIARIPGAGRVACATHVYREDDGPDMVQLLLPLGSLATVFPIGDYPFDDGGDLAWRERLDGWLRGLAEHVRRAVTFELALVGWLDGQPSAIPERAGEVPDERWIGYLVQGVDGLEWHPPNKGAPLG